MEQVAGSRREPLSYSAGTGCRAGSKSSRIQTWHVRNPVLAGALGLLAGARARGDRAYDEGPA